MDDEVNSPTLSGVVTIERTSCRYSPVKQVVDRLAVMLQAERARGIVTSDTSVQFRGGVFRLVGRFNVLLPFGFGYMDVGETTDELLVGYCNSMLQLLTVSAAKALVIGGRALFSSDVPVLAITFEFGLGFALLYGCNSFVAQTRFPGWITKGLVIESVGDAEGSS